MDPVKDLEDSTPTPEELAEQERLAAIARGDVVAEEGDLGNADDKEQKKTDVDADKDILEADDKDDEDLELDDETDEERAEREAEEARLAAEEEKRKKQRIPLHRHEDMLNKAREREEALKKQIDAMQKQVDRAPAQPEAAKAKGPSQTEQLQTHITTLEDEYEDLLIDGEKEKARAVRTQLNQARAQLNQHQLATTTVAAQRSTIETLKYEQALAGIEGTYPELNPDTDVFDAEKTDEVAMLTESLIDRGYTRQAALAKAAGYVMGAPPEPDTGKTDDEKKDELDARRATRAEAARRKAADAAAKQPAPTSKAGVDSDRAGGKQTELDITRMSQDRFAKLDEETKARLRGDEV